MSETRRALFVREAGGLGDIVCCVAAVDAWARAFPEWEAHFLTLECYRGLAALGLNEPNTRLLTLPPNVRRGEMHEPLFHRLRRYAPAHSGLFAYDKIVDFWCPADAEERKSDGRPARGRLQCFFDAAGVTSLAAPPRFVFPEPALDWAESLLDDAGVARPRVLVFPYSAHGSKDWPLERWQRVVDAFGREHFFTPQVKSGAKWRGKLDGVPALMGASHVQVAALIFAADLVLCGDTGPLHIAAACDTPTVAVFGPTDGEAMTRPYPFARAVEAPRCEFPCRPCLRYVTNGWGRCDGRAPVDCLSGLAPERAIEAVRDFLGEPE